MKNRKQTQQVPFSNEFYSEELEEVMLETKQSRIVERKNKERPSKDDLMDKFYD